MNLKRLRNIASFALITAAVALFAGCMNPMAGSTDGGGNSAGQAVLHMSATGIPTEYAKDFEAYNDIKNMQRTIMPDNPFTLPDTRITFVLIGRNEAGSKYGPQLVILKPNNAGTAYDFELPSGLPVTMDALFWTLTLTAYKTDANVTNGYDVSAPVFVGYCSVDLHGGSDTASFVMGIAGLGTTADSVTVTGSIIDDDGLAKYGEAGIYRMIDLEPLAGTVLTANYDPTNKTFKYIAQNVAPGKYLYIIRFYDSADNTGKIIGSYTEPIVINPGNDLEHDIGVRDCLKKKPTPPTNLMAYLVQGSESPDGKTYLVGVTWTASDYETNYELNLVESAIDGTDIVFAADGKTLTATNDGTIYGMAAMGRTDGVVDFPGSPVFGDNSKPMIYGDKECVLRLETGKVYDIQLRARNYIGASDWADRVAGADATKGTAYDAPDNQRINRMYVSYNLNGGFLYKDGGNPKTGIVLDYHSWISDTDLLKIEGTTTLVNGSGTNFVSWQLVEGTALGPDPDSTVNPAPITTITDAGDTVTGYTYMNATVKASYGNKVRGNVTDGTKMTDISLDDISVQLLNNNETAAPAASMTGGITSDGKGMNYKIEKLDANDDPNIIRIEVDGAGTKYNNLKCYAWAGDNFIGKDEFTFSAVGVVKVSTKTYSP